jgi:hypothetical protein
MRPPFLNLVAILGTSATLAACAADLTGNASAAGAVSLSFAATGASTTSTPSSLGSATGGLLGSSSSSSSADALVITKARLVLARLELQRAGGTCTSATESGDDHPSSTESCEELELVPRVIDLAVDGSVVNALSLSAPAGTYSALEAKIRPVDARGSGAAQFLTANPELTNSSVLVEGTFNGKPFTYTGAARAELESAFNPPLVADATGINVTVKVDLTNWFRSTSGALIDPSTANSGGVNASLVASNIARSFTAFRDDDHNGRDDDGRDGSSGSGNGGQSGHD